VFVRPPRVRVASELGASLGECALGEGQAKCEITLPYANAYVITLDDATNPARDATFRIDAPWETKSIDLDSQHRDGEGLLWWTAVNVTVDTDAVADGVTLSLGDEIGYFIENALESDVWAFGHPSFSAFEHDVWARISVRILFCNTGSEQRGIRIPPGTREQVALDSVHALARGPLPEGGYRVEQLVEIVRAAGEDVSREASRSHVPVPAVFERRLARVDLDSLDGWLR
jgi:hypothetical protein